MFRVQKIDHVELFVPDRFEAATWYLRVLGLEIVAEFGGWAAPPGGPLMISSDGGVTKLALFERSNPSAPSGGGFRRVAFSTDASGFIEFLSRLADLKVIGAAGPESVVDHDLAYSVYFEDPWGHSLEVTTYDYKEVTAALAQRDPR